MNGGELRWYGGELRWDSSELGLQSRCKLQGQSGINEILRLLRRRWRSIAFQTSENVAYPSAETHYSQLVSVVEESGSILFFQLPPLLLFLLAQLDRPLKVLVLRRLVLHRRRLLALLNRALEVLVLSIR